VSANGKLTRLLMRKRTQPQTQLDGRCQQIRTQPRNLGLRQFPSVHTTHVVSVPNQQILHCASLMLGVIDRKYGSTTTANSQTAISSPRVPTESSHTTVHTRPELPEVRSNCHSDVSCSVVIRHICTAASHAAETCAKSAIKRSSARKRQLEVSFIVVIVCRLVFELGIVRIAAHEPSYGAACCQRRYHFFGNGNTDDRWGQCHLGISNS
jgi:hypothetical protein